MTTMDLESQVELYDSDILKIEQGPLAWANSQIGTARNLDGFVERLKDEFLKIGFYIYVELGQHADCTCRDGKCVDLTKCPTLQITDNEVFMPMVKISGRVSVQPFDFEQMQWEVRNNILNMPGQDKGVIKFNGKAEGGSHRH